jgi:hypothetical protein
MAEEVGFDAIDAGRSATEVQMIGNGFAYFSAVFVEHQPDRLILGFHFNAEI